jgi:hypothetical protein
MVYKAAKQKLLDFFQYNIAPRIEGLHAEQIFQGIFHRQCDQFGIKEAFYPVGAAASYGLMYLLTRALTELPVRRIVEMGSGQSTILIDRLRSGEGAHVAYEQNEFWAGSVAAQVPRCDVRHRPLVPKTFRGISYDGYTDLEAVEFDLLLVDGPNGTDHASRFDCVQLVNDTKATEFIVVVDDAGRPGEQETVAEIVRVLKGRGLDFKLNHLSGRTQQAVFTTPRFRAASYYF